MIKYIFIADVLLLIIFIRYFKNNLLILIPFFILFFIFLNFDYKNSKYNNQKYIIDLNTKKIDKIFDQNNLNQKKKIGSIDLFEFSYPNKLIISGWSKVEDRHEKNVLILVYKGFYIDNFDTNLKRKDLISLKIASKVQKNGFWIEILNIDKNQICDIELISLMSNSEVFKINNKFCD